MNWIPVSEQMPEMGAVVWLWDGERMWIGGRAWVDCETWLWCFAYSSPWWDGGQWDADLDSDDDYRPTHWMNLPDPPKPTPADELRDLAGEE